MIDYIKYRRQIAKLYKQTEKVATFYDDKIKRADNEGKSHNDIMAIEADRLHEWITIDEEIKMLVTNYLIKKSNRIFITIPSHDEDGMWEQCCKISNRYILTNKGISALRTSIRAEKKEQIEMVIKILTTLIGIIGATTGLIAVLLK